jgi:hypothetical protein
MKQKPEWKIRQAFLAAGALVALVAGLASTVPSAYAGGTIKADEDKWISIGMGMRMSGRFREDQAPDGNSYTKGFMIDNARIYINGQIHKYVKFTFNTECFNCGSYTGRFGASNFFSGQSSIGLIDAIGKIEYNKQINFWFGRTLVPFDRGELNGPFYHQTFDGFKTPFLPNDQSANFGLASAGNDGAGLYGRDNGAVFFGRVDPMGTHLLYAFMVHTGLQGAANQGGSLAWSGRFQWNLLADEQESNPGYYTAGGYYGGYGNLAAIALGWNHQHNGAGTALNQNDMTAIVLDFLGEYLVPNNGGIFTFNAEWKRYWGTQLPAYQEFLAGATGQDCMCVFNGNSWTMYLLYLMPQKIGWGQFQPYGRFTDINPINSALRQEWEAGVNYVIDGFNARVSAFWTYGDITTKGFVGGPTVFSPAATGNRVNTFNIALQLQY